MARAHSYGHNGTGTRTVALARWHGHNPTGTMAQGREQLHWHDGTGTITRKIARAQWHRHDSSVTMGTARSRAQWHDHKSTGTGTGTSTITDTMARYRWHGHRLFHNNTCTHTHSRAVLCQTFTIMHQRPIGLHHFIKHHCRPKRLMLITKQKDVVGGADIIIILPSKCCIYP